MEAIGEGVSEFKVGDRVWIFNAQFKRAMGTAAQQSEILRAGEFKLAVVAARYNDDIIEARGRFCRSTARCT